MTNLPLRALTTDAPPQGWNAGEAAARIAALVAQGTRHGHGAGFATTIADPSTGQRRQCYLALEVVAAAFELLADNPQLAIPDAIECVARAKARSDIARVRFLSRSLLMALPAGTQLRTDLVSEAVPHLTEAELATQRSDTPRILVSTPDSTNWAIEVHQSVKHGGTRDQWMSRRIQAHLHLGRHVKDFAGVLVLTPRREQFSVHVPPRGSRHLLGQCEPCVQFARTARLGVSA